MVAMSPNQSRFVTFRWCIAVAAAIAICAFVLSTQHIGRPVIAATTDQPSGVATSFQIPPGYRDWKLISVAVVGPPLSDIRAKLGNDVAINAFRQGTIPYPDGTIIARLAWKQVASKENNDAFRLEAAEQGLSHDATQKLLNGTFAAGPATNVQFMVKDSRKYASTGGWGFFQFTNGKLDSAPAATTCFACHAPNKARDFVFTRYSP